MAAGVPVLCPRSSIYAEYIDHGVDGLLYDTREDAVRQLAGLRGAPARTAALGRAARAKVARFVESKRMASAVRDLLAGRHAPPESARAEPVRRVAAAS
jgi:glycosyltransferase involved in cell wall biosynthesis